MSAQELAVAEACDPEAMFRLLCACAALQLVSYDVAAREFAVTALLDTLRRDAPFSLRNFALSQTAPGRWLSWGHFKRTARSSMSCWCAPRSCPALSSIADDSAGGRRPRPSAADSATVPQLSPGLFDSVPAANFYLLKYIQHDWDDDSCVRILRNVHAAMSPGSRVVVVEILVGETGAPASAC